VISYEQAVRLFAAGLPVVAAVQGAAVGGGLGVALSADFRVASPDSRFSANFARLGIHHGFGITVTPPARRGCPARAGAAYTGARVCAARMRHRIGLCDRLVASDRVREEAVALAEEIGPSRRWRSGPSARPCAGIWPTGSARPTAHEAAEQAKQWGTTDFRRAFAPRRATATAVYRHLDRSPPGFRAAHTPRAGAHRPAAPVVAASAAGAPSAASRWWQLPIA